MRTYLGNGENHEPSTAREEDAVPSRGPGPPHLPTFRACHACVRIPSVLARVTVASAGRGDDEVYMEHGGPRDGNGWNEVIGLGLGLGLGLRDGYG